MEVQGLQEQDDAKECAQSSCYPPKRHKRARVGLERVVCLRFDLEDAGISDGWKNKSNVPSRQCDQSPSWWVVSSTSLQLVMANTGKIPIGSRVIK